MTATAHIPLPSGLRHLVDDLIDAVRASVRAFRRGEYANAPVGEGTLLHRLARILRCAFVILAVHLVAPPLRPRATAAPRPQRALLRRPGFALFPRHRSAFANASPSPQPEALARAASTPRDRMLTAQRKLDALTRALADPLTLVRRMARRLPTRLLVFGWRPPKRPPPPDRRAFWDELVVGFTEARFVLGEWRRRTRDMGLTASGSERSGEREACADER